MKIGYEEMIEMKKRGATYQEIAKEIGVSKQRVHQMLITYDKHLKGIRGHGFDIDTIVFKGIYEHFKKDLYESPSSFTLKVMGNDAKNSLPKVRGFITGKSESRFTIRQLQRICEITGMSFEECFERRDLP